MPTTDDLKTLPLDFLLVAVEVEDPAALFELGRRLLCGTEVEKDEQRAFELFERSARGGFGPGAYWAGRCCEEGHGTKKDLKKALKHYRKAAKKDVSLACLRLGAKYLSGNSVEKDLKLARRFFKKAVRLGAVGDGHVGLGIILEEEGDFEGACRSYETAITHQSIPARYLLARQYCIGCGVPKNIARAAELLKEAMAEGYEFPEVPDVITPLLEAIREGGSIAEA